MLKFPVLPFSALSPRHLQKLVVYLSEYFVFISANKFILKFPFNTLYVCVFVYSGMYNLVNKSVRIFALFKEINVCPNPILTT